MRVIFLQNVPRVGRKHDVKEINDGYAINFLFPKKLAEMATARAIANLEKRKKELVIEKEIEENLLMRNLEQIKEKVVILREKADKIGHLFAQIHKKEIVEALKIQHGATLSEETIVIEKPIKTIGEFKIELSLKDKKSYLKLQVVKN